MRPLELGAFLLLGAIWGSAFLFIKYAVEMPDKAGEPGERPTSFPPVSMVALRLLTAAIVMVGYVIGLAIWSPEYRSTLKATLLSKDGFLWKVSVMGFLNNSAPFTMVAIAESQPSVNVGVTSILDSIIPLFSQLIAHFFEPEERLTKRRALGISVGFVGVFVVCAENIFDVEKGKSAQDSAADAGFYALIIVATASYGAASVWGKLKLSQHDSVTKATGQILSAALMNAALALMWEFQFPVSGFSRHFAWIAHASVLAWMSILYLGVASTCVAYLLYFYLLRTIGSVKQTMVGFLLPVFGVIEGAIFYHDWAGRGWVYIFLEMLGAVLVCFGVYFVNYTRPAAKPEEEIASPAVPSDGYASINGDKGFDERQPLLGGAGSRTRGFSQTNGGDSAAPHWKEERGVVYE